MAFKEVPIYSDLLKANRKNVKLDGFDFDADTFENLIDNFVPFDNVPTILRTTKADLDVFCKALYGLNYVEAYKVLSGITDMYMRKVMKNLAASGNATAINIAAKHFMKLDDDAKNDAINIRIVNDLNGDD